MSANSIELLFKDALEASDHEIFQEAVCQYINEITISSKDIISKRYFEVFCKVFSDNRSKKLKGFIALLLEMCFQKEKLNKSQKDFIKDEVIKSVLLLQETRQLQTAVDSLSNIYEGENLLEVMKELLLVIPKGNEQIRKHIVDLIIANKK